VRTKAGVLLVKLAPQQASAASCDIPENLRRQRTVLQQGVLRRLTEGLQPVGAPINCGRRLEAVVAAAVDFGLASMVVRVPRELDLPPALRSHARAAAQVQIPLERVLRAYTTGYSVFLERLLDAGAVSPASLRSLAIQLDRSVEAITAEYNQAAPGPDGVTPTFKARLVRKLLRGEDADSTALHYAFNGWHAALMFAEEGGVREDLRALARQQDLRLLVAELEEGTITAWFGGGREWLDRLLNDAQTMFRSGIVAAGEPSEGFRGWQLTYRQAESIWPYAHHDARGFYRYADTGLLAAINFNPVLSLSLRGLYVEPLKAEPRLAETVRAYLACGRNASSAAARLGLSRQTVSSRLRAAEEKLGRSLDHCGAEVELALRLDQPREDARKASNV